MNGGRDGWWTGKGVKEGGGREPREALNMSPVYQRGDKLISGQLYVILVNINQ